MKSFSLEKISLLSNLEQSANEFSFSKGLNVVTGRNGVGKSCLIKSLFWTFGAEPGVVHRSWKNAKVSAIVTFSVDGVAYKILREENHFFIFDGAENLLGRFHSVTNELAPFLGRLFEFGLKLPSRTGEEQILPPSYYLAPFYIDQDTGWNDLWHSFSKLEQFTNWKTPLVDYFTGVISDEFLKLKSDIAFLAESITKLKVQKELMDQTFEEIREEVSNADFDFDAKEFKNEIASLLEESDRLKQVEYVYKSDLVKLHEESLVLTQQIRIIEASLGGYAKEKNVVLNQDDEVECPTCGAEYHDNFADRFHIAQDLFRCEELLIELGEDLRNNKNKTEEIQAEFEKVTSSRSEVLEKLERRKGKVSLQDHIKTEGEKHLRSFLREKKSNLRLRIDDLEVTLRALEKERRVMASGLKDKKDRVQDLYLRNMRLYLAELHVTNLSEEAYLRLDRSKIDESGSDSPRARLSYFFSLQNVIREFYGGFLAPIVIDSPNQQDQDSGNEEKIYSFIVEHSNIEQQVILGLADGQERSFGNAKMIILETEARLLSKDAYKSVSPLFTRLLTKGLL